MLQFNSRNKKWEIIEGSEQKYGTINKLEVKRFHEIELYFYNTKIS